MKNNKTNPALIGLFVLVAVGLMSAVILYYSANLFSDNKQTYNIMLRTSTAGLDIGAPVVLQGVKIGEVTDIVVGFNHKINQFEVQVNIVIDRNKVKWPMEIAQTNNDELRSSLIKKGLRAKLAMHSLITGKLMIQIGFHPGSKLVLAGLENEIPSIPSTSLNKLMEDVAALDIKKINDRIEKLANGLERLLTDGNKLINGMDRIFNDGQMQAIEDELLVTLKDIHITVNELNKQIAPLTSNLNNVIVDTQQLLSKVDSKVDGISQSIIYAGSEVGDLSRLLKKNIIPLLDSLKIAVNNVESIIKKGSPLRVELVNALRNINKATLSLNEFADYLERHPEALLKGKR
ncbi:MAG: MCE family protein [Gammaproteobacteria bacterium]|nr:MCE family protein [Gammaproteobacteria bacterium]